MGNPGRSIKGLHLVALSAPVAKLRIVQWSCQKSSALGPSWMALTGCLLVTVAWTFVLNQGGDSSPPSLCLSHLG